MTENCDYIVKGVLLYFPRFELQRYKFAHGWSNEVANT